VINNKTKIVANLIDYMIEKKILKYAFSYLKFSESSHTSPVTDFYISPLSFGIT